MSIFTFWCTLGATILGNSKSLSLDQFKASFKLPPFLVDKVWHRLESRPFMCTQASAMDTPFPAEYQYAPPPDCLLLEYQLQNYDDSCRRSTPQHTLLPSRIMCQFKIDPIRSVSLRTYLISSLNKFHSELESNFNVNPVGLTKFGKFILLTKFHVPRDPMIIDFLYSMNLSIPIVDKTEIK